MGGSELWFSEDGIGWAREQPPDGVRGIIAIPDGFLMYGIGDENVWIYQR
jgi:hypothetical protein